MMMLKRILSAALIVTIAAGLLSCGNGTQPAGNDDDDNDSVKYASCTLEDKDGVSYTIKLPAGQYEFKKTTEQNFQYRICSTDPDVKDPIWIYMDNGKVTDPEAYADDNYAEIQSSGNEGFYSWYYCRMILGYFYIVMFDDYDYPIIIYGEFSANYLKKVFAKCKFGILDPYKMHGFD